jgi:hypothetical protein
VNVSRITGRGLALLVLCTTLASPATAQNRAGLSLGATASNLYGDDIVARGDTEWGFYGGAFGETAVADFLALHLGVNYTQKGGKGLAGAGLLESEQVELELNYIELPLLAEIMLPLGGSWDLMAYGGIAAGFNVTCKAALGGGDKESCKDTVLGGARTEWGLPAGGGLFYTLANGETVVFEARYTWGLNDAVSNAAIRNRSWYFLIRLVKPAG